MIERNERPTAEKARKLAEAVRERQFREMVADAWTEIKWAIHSGHTRANVWIFDKDSAVVTKVVSHFRNQGYKAVRGDDFIIIDWGNKVKEEL